MRLTKLIFIDGLPGLGKTTTATWLASRLRSAGFKTNLLLESQPGHPLNVGGDLHPAGDVTGEALFKRYTPRSYIAESLERWHSSVQTAMQVEAINVLDSYPFQNSIRILLQMNASIESIQAYADQVETLALPLQPVLIYLNHPDLDYATRQFASISAQRGKEWTDYVIALVMRCPYAVANQLVGYEGLMQFLKDYKLLVDDLLKRSRLPRIMLENCAGDWDECYRSIEGFLGM
jgi:hypothetical protein